LDEQILRITLLLRSSPRNAELYFRRAELQRAARQWRPAVSDYRAALSINSNYPAALLGQGFALLGDGDAAAAKQSFNRFLNRFPNNPDALLGRARCSDKLGDIDAAVRDYGNAIHHQAAPTPELFLERFDVLVRSGRKEAALASLAEGERVLGRLATLTIPAVDLDLELGRYDEAAERLTHFVDTSARKETWLARRADVYDRAGRRADARADREAAIRAIQSLPSWRQSDRSTAKLLTQLKERSR
jgi:tetratricopeptide (TPR) repeat protein